MSFIKQKQYFIATQYKEHIFVCKKNLSRQNILLFYNSKKVIHTANLLIKID